MSTADAVKIIVLVGLIAWLMVRHLPGAILFLRPGFIRYRLRAAGEEPQVGVAVADMLGELEALGFTPLASAVEQRPLRRGRDEWVLASDAEHAWAVVRAVRDEAWLHFVSPFEDGMLVISADHVWPAADQPSYQAGGLPGSTPTQLLNAHRRRVQRLLAENRRPGSLGTDARIAMVKKFYGSGPGRAEARRRELRGAVLVAVALTFVGLLLKQLLRR